MLRATRFNHKRRGAGHVMQGGEADVARANQITSVTRRFFMRELLAAGRGNSCPTGLMARWRGSGPPLRGQTTKGVICAVSIAPLTSLFLGC